MPSVRSPLRCEPRTEDNTSSEPRPQRTPPMKTAQDWTLETGCALNDQTVSQVGRPRTYEEARQYFIQTGGSQTYWRLRTCWLLVSSSELGRHERLRTISPSPIVIFSTMDSMIAMLGRSGGLNAGKTIAQARRLLSWSAALREYNAASIGGLSQQSRLFQGLRLFLPAPH